MGKTKNNTPKEARIEWWRSLSEYQKDKQIKIWQQKKAKRRKTYPVVLRTNYRKYPWYETGVNDSNREQWLNCVISKNQWLDTLFLL